MPANQYSDSLLAEALLGSLSNAESLGRGFAVAPIGLLGDINALGREYITPRLPQRVQGLLQSMPAAPTTEQILSNIPRVSAPRRESAGMEQLGAAMNPRGPVDLARGAGRLAGSAINDAMIYGRGPLAAITPQPMRIVPTDVARQIDMPVNLPTSKEFFKAVENEPSAQITEQGLLMNLKRMQKPEQSGMESVRTGVFYLPEGQAANLKHYKGKTAYGGAEAIEGETLYKNPLFVKGATGGKAPENAYDQLAGKGAYQEMRNDALRVRHPELISDKRYNLSDAITPEQFLEKYAPDLIGYGDYIFDNSRQGNQLAYALQEAAVANKVREAGHDAVIGYGKGRGDKGEFFSEVFDVREQAYPTPQGDFELMPQFESLLGQAKPSFIYPQEEALKLAQQRAALPVEQGGLGLLANNTAAEREAAMFPLKAYRGITGDIESSVMPSDYFGSNYFGKGINLTTSPQDASKYASTDVGINHDLVGKAELMSQKLGISYPEAKAELTKGGGTVMPISANIENPLIVGMQKIQAPDSIIRYALNEAGYSGDVDKLVNKFKNANTGIEQFELMQANRATPFYRSMSSLMNKDGLMIDPSLSPKSEGGMHYLANDTDQIRSRFAAFDPWRRTAATAAAMGVAAPDLLAQEQPIITQQQIDDEMMKYGLLGR